MLGTVVLPVCFVGADCGRYLQLREAKKPKISIHTIFQNDEHVADSHSSVAACVSCGAGLDCVSSAVRFSFCKTAESKRYSHTIDRWSSSCCFWVPRFFQFAPRTTHCTTLQHTVTHCNTLQHTTAHCNTLQHTATHCNTLQYTAIHCNILQYIATHCSTLQYTATHCNTLRYTAIHCNALQCTATHCNTLQYTVTNCNTRLLVNLRVLMRWYIHIYIYMYI